MKKSIRIPTGMLTVIVLLFAATFTSAQLSLITGYAGGNGQSGAQFDVVALSTCTITALDANVLAGTWNFEVYIVTGGGTTSCYAGIGEECLSGNNITTSSSLPKIFSKKRREVA